MENTNVIQISCAAYKIFYKKLRDKFLEEHFKDERIKDRIDRLIWDAIDPNSGKPYAKKFLENSNITDTRYLYRKRMDCHNYERQYSVINVQVFLNGLLYLGIQPVETADKFDKMKKYEKAESLHNSFLELYSREISDI